MTFHRFECHYLASKVYENSCSEMWVTDWIDTGTLSITKDSAGHYWKCMGYSISHVTIREVEIIPGPLNAKIEIIKN